MIEEKIYKHSGESNSFGFLAAFGLGAALAILLGFAYNFLIIMIPIVYINFFMSLGFGLILGYGVKFFSRIGKIRNDIQIYSLAGLAGYLGFVFQWIAYFVFLNSGEHSFQAYQNNLDLFYNPVLFLDLLLDLNKVGSWGMFGITFTDFPLWIIWGLEALLIIGMPVLITYKHPIVPFSENFNKWYPKYILKNQFEHISTQKQFKESLSQDVFGAIDHLHYGEPYRYSEVSIYYIEKEKTQFLSVDNVYISERGKGKHMRSSVVHLLEIEHKVAESIMEKYESKKQFALDY